MSALNLSDRFDSVARNAAWRTAVCEEGASMSYEVLLRWSQEISTQLERHCPMDGHRAVLIIPNSAAFVASFFAVARSGGVVAPLSVDYRSQELEYYLRDIQPTAVLTCEANASHVREALDRVSLKSMVVVVESPGSCEILAKGEGPGDVSGSVNENSAALLLYTSGSTGRPKRVVRTHGQLIGECETLLDLFSIDVADRFLGAAPFSHVNGLVRTMLTSMLDGAALYPVRRFNRRGVLRLISEERLTFFGGVAQMFVALALSRPHGDIDLSSLRIVFSSSAPLLPRDYREFQRAYRVSIRQLYGSTETGTISYNDHSDLARHLDSVGRPLPGVALTVIDENGRALPYENEGEIVVSSPFAISSYDGNTAVSRASFRDGCYLTGDLGLMNSEGYLTLTGRKKFVINRGGFKVNPYEVEEAIREYPKVSEVVAVGTRGPHGDDIIRCVVVPNAVCTPEEIIRHCQQRIAAYKIPSRIEFRASLPKTASGKIARASL